MGTTRGAPDARRRARRVRAGGPGRRTGGDTGTAPWADLTNGDGAEPIDWQQTHTGLYIGDGHTIEGNTGGAPNHVLEHAITLGAKNIWGAIDWPRYWTGHDGSRQAPGGGNRFAGYPMIERGSKGDTVKTFQRDINIVLERHLDVDGEYGPIAEAACKDFQRVGRIEVDGQCGPQTWATLDVALDKLGR